VIGATSAAPASAVWVLASWACDEARLARSAVSCVADAPFVSSLASGRFVRRHLRLGLYDRAGERRRSIVAEHLALVTFWPAFTLTAVTVPKT